MNASFIHENICRGTEGFPVELYSIDENDPRYFMQLHWHKDFEIIRVTEGTFYLTLNTRVFTLKKGASAVIPGGIVHGGEPCGCRYECIVFAAELLYAVRDCRNTVKAYMQTPVIYDNNSDIDLLFSLFSKFLPDSENSGRYKLKIVSLLYKIAADIAESNSEAQIYPDARIEKVKAAITLIENNYGRKITLNELAEECCMSPNYFIRFFKELTRQTPFEYIKAYRLKIAAERLSLGAESVTEVCFACGFNDLSYFIHVFKTHIGISPKEYKKRAGERTAEKNPHNGISENDEPCKRQP